MEDWKENLRENRTRNENGKLQTPQNSSIGMEQTAGTLTQKQGQEKKNPTLLEEHSKRGRHGLNINWTPHSGQGGMEEEDQRETGPPGKIWKGNLVVKSERTTTNRNVAPPKEETRCHLCERIFKSKAGLEYIGRRRFCCDMCGLVVETEAAKRNHENSCRVVQAADDSRRACEKCEREVSKSNIARHRRACTVGEARGGGARGVVRPEDQRVARETRQKRCPACGEMKSAANLARHMRRSSWAVAEDVWPVTMTKCRWWKNNSLRDWIYLQRVLLLADDLRIWQQKCRN